MATRRHGPGPVFERLYRRFKRAPLPWLARLRRWVIGEHAAAVVVDSASGLLLTPVSDFYIGRKLAPRGAFGTRTVELLLHLVELRELLFELRDPLFSEAQTAGSRFQTFGT